MTNGRGVGGWKRKGGGWCRQEEEDDQIVPLLPSYLVLGGEGWVCPLFCRTIGVFFAFENAWFFVDVATPKGPFRTNN